MASSSDPASAPSHRSARVAVVVMGVSAAGKTTVGKRLAETLGIEFIDGDDLHSPAARAKMASGQALDDADRWPWLDRDRLRAGAGPGLRFVYLESNPDLMRARVAGRRHNYMPVSLVDSQSAALEPPIGEKDVITTAADAELDAAIPKLAEEIAHG